MGKKMVPVTGRRSLAGGLTPESGTAGIITQNSINEKETRMRSRRFVFYVKEGSRPEGGIHWPENVYDRMKDLAKADQESFWVIAVNTRNKEIFNECLFIGGINQAPFDPRILFKRLLGIGAVAFVAVHNHPSGDYNPSKDDIELTNRIKQISEIIGIDFLDHLIIGDTGYYSFKTFCMGKLAWKDGDSRKKPSKQPKTGKATKCDKGTPEISQQRRDTLLTVDFCRYPSILKELEQLAEQEVRSVDS